MFSGFFLGSLLGIVLAGWAADRRGTRLPFAAGLALFTVGLIVGGTAPSMAILVVGRVLQGIGAGVIPAVAYATVARSYPPDLRPRVFAVFSTAWVVPGLVGPAAASGIEHATSWRVVFLALLPLVAIAAALALPVLSDRGPAGGRARGGDGDAAADADPDPDSRRRNAVVLVAGVALVLGGLGAHQVALAVALVVAGAIPAAWAFLRLVPAGTVRLRPGLPAAVATRGVLTFAFFGADAYVSLAVTDGHDAPTWVAGLALTGATLAWTTGAWVQQRLVLRPRTPLARAARLRVDRGRHRRPGARPASGRAGGRHRGGLDGRRPGHGPVVRPDLGDGAGHAPSRARRAGRARRCSSPTCSAWRSAPGWAACSSPLGDGRGWATSSSLTIAFAMTLAVAVAGVAAAGRLPRRLPGVDAAG